MKVTKVDKEPVQVFNFGRKISDPVALAAVANFEAEMDALASKISNEEVLARINKECIKMGLPIK